MYNNRQLVSPSDMSPASFGLKPCGCCFLLTFTQLFFPLSALSFPPLSTQCSRLSFSLILLAIFFIFVCLTAETPHPYPGSTQIQKLRSPQWEGEEMKAAQLLTAHFFPSLVLFFFYPPNLCPQSQRRPHELEGDSVCFLFLTECR